MGKVLTNLKGALESELLLNYRKKKTQFEWCETDQRMNIMVTKKHFYIPDNIVDVNNGFHLSRRQGVHVIDAC
jgi:hypothetical protein